MPVSDQLLKGKLKDECQKALGISLTVETINGDGVQARITSAIQAKTGPDIMMAVNNWAQLYADSVVDVSDIAEEVGKAQGGYFETARAVANDGKKWIAMPFTILGVLFVNRTSWFAEEGITPDKFPKTWEEYRAVGKKLKAKNRPLGQTLAHAFGDGPAFWYPYLWSWGGKEVEADGKTVVLNSKETIESVKFAAGFWKDAFDEGGMSWDDAGNNRAFLSNTISSTSNGASIYLLARSKPDTYMTETGKPIKDDCFHAPLPRGPAGQFSYHVPFSNLDPELQREPESRQGVPALVPFHRGLRHLVHLAAGLLGGHDQDVGEQQAVESRPGDGAVPHRGGKRPLRRLCRAGGTRGRRDDQQVHHRRHVRQGGAGHAGGRSGQMGPFRTGEDLRLKPGRERSCDVLGVGTPGPRIKLTSRMGFGPR